MKNNGIQEKDYIKYQLDQLEARENHHKYLEKLEEGKQDLDDMRHSYLDTLRRTEELLRTSVIESERVPNKIGTKANEYGLSLKVQSIEVKKKKEEKAAGSRLSSLLPSATYNVDKLRSKRVIARLNRNVKEKEFKNIDFQFSLMDSGAWEVVVRYRDGKTINILCCFSISRAEVEDFKCKKKSARLPFADGFVWMNCFETIQLLARISATQVMPELRPPKQLVA